MITYAYRPYCPFCGHQCVTVLRDPYDGELLGCNVCVSNMRNAEDDEQEFPDDYINDMTLEKMWGDFAEIPVDLETKRIKEPFRNFPAGTLRKDILRWFDRHYSKGIRYLMHDGRGVVT